MDLQPPEFKDDDVPEKSSTKINFYDVFINLSSVSTSLLQKFIPYHQTKQLAVHRSNTAGSHPIRRHSSKRRPFNRQPLPRQIQALLRCEIPTSLRLAVWNRLLEYIFTLLRTTREAHWSPLFDLTGSSHVTPVRREPTVAEARHTSPNSLILLSIVGRDE